jgi:CRISPR-associated protein Cas6
VQIEARFPITGDTLPTDHAYLLYSALSHGVPEFHANEGGMRFSPINGESHKQGLIRVFSKSRLRVRFDADRIATVLPLAGQKLKVGEHAIRLGAPTVVSLEAASILTAPFVTFKNSDTPERFMEVAREKLNALNVAAEPGIPLAEKGARAGEPRRRIVHIKGMKIVGYPLVVQGLTADESIRLQEQGLGGRTRIGCGFFVPHREFAR